MKDNTPIEEQIKILADFLMKYYPQEITEGGAVETAIKILKKKVKLPIIARITSNRSKGIKK